MEWEEIRQALIDEGVLINENFPDDTSWVTVYARALGRCTYCDCDVLVHRSGYAGAERDHLLPRHSLPEHLRPEVEAGPDYINLVLACCACNRIKHGHSVLEEGEDPQEALTNNRPELISRAREYVEQRYLENGAHWEATKRIILGAVRDWGNQPADN